MFFILFNLLVTIFLMFNFFQRITGDIFREENVDIKEEDSRVIEKDIEENDIDISNTCSEIDKVT